MTNRRQFIQSSLAISALSFTELAAMRTVVAGETVAGEAGANKTVPVLENFVYDRRFPEAIAAAQQVAGQGIVLREIEGDLTDLWYEFYSEQWRKQPMTLAGVTASDALFVLETLAYDHGMRVIKRAAHQRQPQHSTDNTELYSWVIAPKAFAV